ncbi:hypothetical protein [Undibacterium fentianense]|uniref:Uncharacterized protein n=1 Tax=Undibacterium fentianense TaxID=2828728 RepID=A0A941IC15_9BURK|nr:hypothetical protein [Undibacterium fentianense]MBR7799699.1 hypothetical protein [Undibacterium fentianense]
MRSKGRIVNTRFFAITAYYQFDPDFSNGASGWKKWIAEKRVLDCRRRVWHKATLERSGSLAEPNAQLGTQYNRFWSEYCHPDYPNLPAADLLGQQKVSQNSMSSNRRYFHIAK